VAPDWFGRHYSIAFGHRDPFYLQAIVHIIKDRVDVVTLYHINKHNLVMIVALLLLRRKVYLKLDMDKNWALQLVASWAKFFRFKSFLQKLILSFVDCISCEDLEVFNLLKKYNFGTRSLILVPNCMLEDVVPISTNLLTTRENTFLVVGRLGEYQKNIELIFLH
jgi:glycosyltransferase involved in cell wall biosynthesis